METLMATPSVGITFLIVFVVVIFFQVIIHNTQENKRFKKLEEQLKNIEEQLKKNEANNTSR